MAIASITAWLNSPKRDFFHGKMLYEQYGENKLILTLIRTGSTSYHFNKLLAGMEELNKLPNKEPKQIKFVEPPPLDNNTDKWSGAPDPILEIRNEKNRRYALARRLFEMIRSMDSQEHRTEAALELLDHMDFVNESWGAIDQWRETGVVRELTKKEAEKTVADLDLKDLLKQSKNIDSYISKDKKRLEETADPKYKVKIKARLELNELKRSEMKRRIDELV